MKVHSIICMISLGTAFSVPSYALSSMESGMEIAERVYGSDDPEAAIQSLGDSERELLRTVLTPGALEEETELLAGPDTRAYSGCYAWRYKSARKALAGNTLYTYWQTTQVCVTNGRVTSVQINEADGETSTPGWRIAHNPTRALKNVGWEGRGVAKYFFVLGAGGWDIQHPTDCLQVRLNGNGTSRRSLNDCSLDAN